jgi:hypothetical protein
VVVVHVKILSNYFPGGIKYTSKTRCLSNTDQECNVLYKGFRYLAPHPLLRLFSIG